MHYLRCLICSVPVFNVNCGSADCVHKLHALCTSEATHRPRVSLDPADCLLVPIRSQVGLLPRRVEHGLSASAYPSLLRREASPPAPASDALYSALGIESASFGTGSGHTGAAFVEQEPDLAGAEAARPETIPQIPYRPRGSKRSLSAAPIVFGGITIGDALRNQLDRLADSDKPAFHSVRTEVSQKMSLRIHIADHAVYHRQVNVLRAKGRIPTRGELAFSVARDVNRFLEREKQAGQPVLYDGRELTANNVVLLGVQQVSQGSLQPELGIVSESTVP